jgi:uncharacterized protein (DUF983 family)
MNREIPTWLHMAITLSAIISFSLSLSFLILANGVLGTEFFIIGWMIFPVVMFFHGEE